MGLNRLLKYFTHSQPDPKPKVVPTTALEERQELLAHFVSLVAKKMSNGLFVYGSKGGLGKSKTILRVLSDSSIRPVILNGHCTPMALYEALYRNQDAVIVLDDADSLYRNLAALGILRSALWGETNDRRLVTYNSTQSDLPQSFYFTGQIIFVANVIPRKNAAFEAVLSRVDVFELDASNEEVIQLMRKLAVEGFDGLLTATECLEVVEFIATFASTRELSLRLLEPSFRKVIYAKEAKIDWRELVQTQLEQIGVDDAPKPIDTKACDLASLEQAIQSHPDSVQNQQEAWCKVTGKSRASFFRLKKSLEEPPKPEQPPTDLPPPINPENN